MSNHTCDGKCFDGTYYNPVMDNEIGCIPKDSDPCMHAKKHYSTYHYDENLAITYSLSYDNIPWKKAY